MALVWGACPAVCAEVVILAYYSGLVVRGLTDDETHVCTIPSCWPSMFSRAGAMFAVKSEDGARLNYYNYNSRFDYLSCSLLFRLPVKVLDALKYFSFNKFALRMNDDQFQWLWQFVGASRWIDLRRLYGMGFCCITSGSVEFICWI